MKKKIFVGIVCLAAAGASGFAQVAGNETVIHDIAAAPVPPLPPDAPPPPPVPELLIPAPPEPFVTVAENMEIFSDSGYQLSVKSVNGNTVIYARKHGKTEKIKLSTWNANRKFYEKKYGRLPPPPPPPPPPPVRD